MGGAAVALTRDQKEAIETVAVGFMEKHLKDVITRLSAEKQPPSQALYLRELDLVERVTRVEEELKSQRELMINRFEAMDKRFEDMQKYMDRRFASMQWMMGLGFTSILVATTVLKFLA